MLRRRRTVRFHSVSLNDRGRSRHVRTRNVWGTLGFRGETADDSRQHGRENMEKQRRPLANAELEGEMETKKKKRQNTLRKKRKRRGL